MRGTRATHSEAGRTAYREWVVDPASFAAADDCPAHPSPCMNLFMEMMPIAVAAPRGYLITVRAPFDATSGTECPNTQSAGTQLIGATTFQKDGAGPIHRPRRRRLSDTKQLRELHGSFTFAQAHDDLVTRRADRRNCGDIRRPAVRVWQLGGTESPHLGSSTLPRISDSG